MAVAEHTYSYLPPSSVAIEDGRSELTLATSGGPQAHPYFFTGFLGRPQQTAQALLAVAEVARTRYYEPPQMSAARILAADPVVTSNVDRLGFESFSACAGVYARLDVDPDLLDEPAAAWGTTNVDFNPPIRAALAGVRDADAMLMHVGHDEVRVTGAASRRRPGVAAARSCCARRDGRSARATLGGAARHARSPRGGARACSAGRARRQAAEARATLERFGSQVSRSSKLGRTVQSLLALTPQPAL